MISDARESVTHGEREQFCERTLELDEVLYMKSISEPSRACSGCT